MHESFKCHFPIGLFLAISELVGESQRQALVFGDVTVKYYPRFSASQPHQRHLLPLRNANACVSLSLWGFVLSLVTSEDIALCNRQFA